MQSYLGSLRLEKGKKFESLLLRTFQLLNESGLLTSKNDIETMEWIGSDLTSSKPKHLIKVNDPDSLFHLLFQLKELGIVDCKWSSTALICLK